jgi:octaprenyl-diphosphate synthase
VLLGDALFAQSLQLASRFPTTEVCRQVSEATRKICAGEIEQTLDGGNDGDGIERYFRIIERKTAVLFQVSCRLGALLGRPGPEFSDAAGEFGRRLGIAYQIYDDLVDVIGSESVIGKTLGTDFASGKETLPFLLLRESADREGEPFPVDGLREDAFADGSDPRKLVFERGVVPRVADYFHREIAGALRAVDEFDGFGNVDRLRQIAGFVERRFRRLLELHAE